MAQHMFAANSEPQHGSTPRPGWQGWEGLLGALLLALVLIVFALMLTLQGAQGVRQATDPPWSGHGVTTGQMAAMDWL